MKLSKKIFFPVLAWILFSASLSCYSQNIEVNPLTGAPAISIPIYKLEYGKISIPIEVVRTSTSLKVLDSESDGGFGWGLSCNYAVHREVKGLPDELTSGATSDRSGWLANNGYAAWSVFDFTPGSPDDYTLSTTTVTAGETADYNQLTTWSNPLNMQDTEPDVFTIVGPKLYVQFVFDASGKPRLLNYEDVKITANINSSSTITVQNNLGWTYVFDKPTTVTRTIGRNLLGSLPPLDMLVTQYNSYDDLAHMGNRISYINSWLLTSVTDENGNAVNFGYSIDSGDNGESGWTARIKSGTTIDSLYYYTDTDQLGWGLTSITAGKYSVNINRSGRLVGYIQISESELGDILQYKFTYQRAKSSADNSGAPVVHNFLTAITPHDVANCVPQVPYKFSYNYLTPTSGIASIDMPWHTITGLDFWGGYNGAATTNLNVPQIYFNPYQTDNLRFTVSQIPGVTPAQTLSGNNRNVNREPMLIGSLSQITYPTGGITQFFWERNKYYDSQTHQVFFGPDLRIAYMLSAAGEAAFGSSSNLYNDYHVMRKDYLYQTSDTDTTSCGKILYPPTFAFATGGASIIRTPYNNYPANQVFYSRVKEVVRGQGSTVYEYSLPAMYPTQTQGDWTATWSKIARGTALALNNVRNGYYTFPFAPNPNYSFARGLLTRQAQYSETGALIRETLNQYARVNAAPQNVYGVKYEKIDECSCFHFAKYQYITGVTNVLSQQTKHEWSENSSDFTTVITNYRYNNDVVNKNFLLNQIQTIFSDGSMKTTKITYVKDFAAITNPTSTDQMANAIKAMVAANRHGEWVEQSTSITPAGGTEVVSDASLRLFNIYSAGQSPRLYQTYSLPQGVAFTPAAVVTGTNQGFSWDSDYLLKSTVTEYDGVANVASVTDDKKNRLANHQAQSFSIGPVATFANTLASQTVYDGFEFTTGRELSGRVLSTLLAKTGKRSTTLAPITGLLFNNSIANAGKPYRVSLWVNSTATATITIKFVDALNPGTTVTTVPLNYTTPNNWAYLEGTLNVTSSSPATLRVEVTTSAGVNIDDFLVLPIDATVSTKTYLPLKGVTSQSDDRGNSVSTTYDALGRKVNSFDRQGNMIEHYDYQFNSGALVAINSSWSAQDIATNWGTLIAGSNFNLIASGDACVSSIAFEWRIDGAVVGSTNPLVSSIATPGTHTIQLTVTNTATGDYGVTSRAVCVNVPSPSAVSFTLSGTSSTQGSCDTNPIMVYVSGVTGGSCGYKTTTSYLWAVSFDNGMTFIPQTGIANKLFVSYPSQRNGYIVQATVTVTCSTSDPTCPGTVSSTATQLFSIGWVNQGLCP